MKIVFNTKSLLKDNQEDEYFPHELLNGMIRKYPDHEFIIITDHIDKDLYHVGKNVTTVITRQPVGHPLLIKLWFDFRLPSILKKYKADVFVSCNGFCSLRAQLPQCLLLHDLTFFYNTTVIKKSHLFFYKRYLPKFLHKATAIAAVSAFCKKDLPLRYKIAEDKIAVIYPAAKQAFLPVDESMKKEIKTKYCDGKSYFIYNQGIHSHKSLMTLLKAFSVFKKRQKSDWKLVVSGRMGRGNISFTENLKRYKYREDIVLTGFVEGEDMIRLIGSAYALVHSTQWDWATQAVLNAMSCHIPVIASADPFTKEIAGDAVLYANTDDYTDVAEKMMLLYKDELLRNNLAENGQTVVEKYNWDKTADALWQSIQKAYTSDSKIQQ